MDTPTTSPVPDPKLHFLDYWRIIRIRKTIILSVFILVLFTATGVTLLLKPTYMSAARMKVQKDQSDISFLDARSPYTYDPYFIQTEYEVIQSQSVLYRVISNLNLTVVWGKKYYGGQTLTIPQTYTLLKQVLVVVPERNTSLIEIRFYSRDREEAALIANEVATVYEKYRADQCKEQSLAGIKALREEFDKHEEKVREAQTNVDRLRIELNISEYDAANNMPTPTLDSMVLQRLAAQLAEAEPQLIKEEKLLSQLKPLSRNDLKKVIPTAAPDPLLHNALLNLNDAEQKLVDLKKVYGPENPEVIRVSAQVDRANQEINDRIDGVLIGLAASVDAKRASVEKMKSIVEEAKKADQEKAKDSRPYFEAKRKLDELQRFETLLTQKINAELVQVRLPQTAIVTIVDHAEPSLKPVSPKKVLNITLGVIVGLVVGIGLAFFIEYLDTSVKTIDDVERALQSPVLGVIPQNVGRLIDEDAESPHAEAYRVLRTNLLFSRKDDKLNSLAVVSAGAGEGKSTTVFNLATVFAQNGLRVVIVDSDLRRPSLHKFLGVSNAIGLTNYLLKQNTLEEVIQTTRLATLDFLPSGKLPSSSMGILSSAAMKNLITELKQRYDFVFFDSPPIMGVSDASILASEVDMTLQVIQYRRYPQPMNIRAKHLIEKVGGHHMGIVLNNINMSQDENYYYYSGYYHEYYSKNSDDDESGAGKKPRKA
jgi:succinoglycan biosynthesis transport protein ExoP